MPRRPQGGARRRRRDRAHGGRRVAEDAAVPVTRAGGAGRGRTRRANRSAPDGHFSPRRCRSRRNYCSPAERQPRAPRNVRWVRRGKLGTRGSIARRRIKVPPPDLTSHRAGESGQTTLTALPWGREYFQRKLNAALCTCPSVNFSCSCRHVPAHALSVAHT